jgi:hypothetical protein
VCSALISTGDDGMAMGFSCCSDAMLYEFALAIALSETVCGCDLVDRIREDPSTVNRIGRIISKRPVNLPD